MSVAETAGLRVNVAPHSVDNTMRSFTPVSLFESANYQQELILPLEGEEFPEELAQFLATIARTAIIYPNGEADENHMYPEGFQTTQYFIDYNKDLWGEVRRGIGDGNEFIPPADDPENGGIGTRYRQLKHVYQVGIVARSLAFGIDEPINTYGQTHQQLLRQVDEHAADHDMGRRIVVNGKHPWYGDRILTQMGAPEERIKFATQHDGFGTGHRDREDTNIIDAVLEAKGDQEKMKKLAQERFEELGLAASLVLLGDNAKSYSKEDIHNPEIDGISEKKLQEAIKRKTSTPEGYEENGEKHMQELAAHEFLLAFKDHVCQTLGIDFDLAIERARSTWEYNRFDAAIYDYVYNPGQLNPEAINVLDMNYTVCDPNDGPVAYISNNTDIFF